MGGGCYLNKTRLFLEPSPVDNGQEHTLGPEPGMFLEIKSFFYHLAVSRHLFPRSVIFLVLCSLFMITINAFICYASELEF